MKRIKFNAPVTLGFAVISLGIVLLTGLLGSDFSYMFASIHSGSLADPLFYLRLFTHVLGHASWEHFYSNMLFILLLGPILEEKYGSKVIFRMIMITALVTAVIHLIFGAGTLLGASGSSVYVHSPGRRSQMYVMAKYRLLLS